MESNQSQESALSEHKDLANPDDSQSSELKVQPDSGMNAPTFILSDAQNQDFNSNTMILDDSENSDFHANTIILNDSDNDGLQAHTLILAGNQKKKTIQSGLSGNTFILPETGNIRLRDFDISHLRKSSLSDINPVKSHKTLIDSDNAMGSDTVFLPEDDAGSEPDNSSQTSGTNANQSQNSTSSGKNIKKQKFTDSKASLPSVGEIIGHYKIISELGRGGFGAVYYAQNMILGRDEALKLILPSARSEFKDIEMRFVREINIVARLEHPNIVRLYSSGHLPGGILWMTMELIRGERLDKKLQKDGAFSFDKARTFMLQLLSALSEAHSRDIVHRDLKPANIMIQQKKGYEDLVVILDFGLSKAIGPSDDNMLQNLTQDSKQVYGTPQYMAPEQLNKGIIGPWTDVYSAGLIFYEILTAHPGFSGTTIFDIAYKQRHQSLNFPDHLKNTAIQNIINKACAKSISDRYQNASEFYDDIFKLTENVMIFVPGLSENSISEKESNDSLFPLICLLILITLLVLLMF